jgi:hypothetical protein
MELHACNPIYLRDGGKRIVAPNQFGEKNAGFYQKRSKEKTSGGMIQVVELLGFKILSEHEASSLCKEN